MTLQNSIAGEWLASAATATVRVHNPSTGEIIAETPFSSASELDLAVQAAQKASCVLARWRKRSQ